jgi:hypothetical protein
MTDIEKIRFITVNYSRLQGLKAVPWGLLLFLIVLWSNAQTGPARDLTLPLLLLGAGMVLYAAIDWYYKRTYGRVEPAGHALIADVILSTGFSAVAIGAFVLDTRSIVPVNLFALVFAVSLVLDYYRMLHLAGVKRAVIFPVGLFCIIDIGLAAFLPLIGESVWRGIGFRSPIFFVYAVIGIIIVIYGVAGHLYLVRSMPPSAEVEHG